MRLETGAGEEIFSAEDSFLRGKSGRGGERCVFEVGLWRFFFCFGGGGGLWGGVGVGEV